MFLVTGLGDRLREARTTKGFTLDDLQSITKIQKRYLSGIENEDYGMMPGSFYVRAFIKQYSEAVGLDPDEMLSLYRESSAAVMPEEEERQITKPSLNRRSISKRNNKINEIVPKIIVALFILVFIAALWFFYKNMQATKPNEDVELTDPIKVEGSNKPGTPTIVDDNKDDEDKTDTVEPEPDPEPVVQSLTNMSVSGETSTYSLTGADTFLLEIRTTGGSWIGVIDNSRKEWMTPARIMNAGEVVEFDVSETDNVRIRVGRVKNTEIYVNGELLNYASDGVTQNIVIEYKKEQ